MKFVPSLPVLPDYPHGDHDAYLHSVPRIPTTTKKRCHMWNYNVKTLLKTPNLLQMIILITLLTLLVILRMIMMFINTPRALVWSQGFQAGVICPVTAESQPTPVKSIIPIF